MPLQGQNINIQVVWILKLFLISNMSSILFLALSGTQKTWSKMISLSLINSDKCTFFDDQ
jgi:hypothetical protein